MFKLPLCASLLLLPSTLFAAELSPSAANAVDREDLTRKLTGKESTSPLEEILRRMAISEFRLKSFDPSELTQEHQRRILQNLDSLIALAAPMTPNHPSGAGSPPTSTQPSPSENSATAAAPSNSSAAPSTASALSTSPLLDTRSSSWNPLRPRDLAEITQHINEDFVPQYKAETTRYFEALAQIGKAARNP